MVSEISFESREISQEFYSARQPASGLVGKYVNWLRSSEEYGGICKIVAYIITFFLSLILIATVIGIPVFLSGHREFILQTEEIHKKEQFQRIFDEFTEKLQQVEHTKFELKKQLHEANKKHKAKNLIFFENEESEKADSKSKKIKKEMAQLQGQIDELKTQNASMNQYIEEINQRATREEKNVKTELLQLMQDFDEINLEAKTLKEELNSSNLVNQTLRLEFNRLREVEKEFQKQKENHQIQTVELQELQVQLKNADKKIQQQQTVINDFLKLSTQGKN